MSLDQKFSAEHQFRKTCIPVHHIAYQLQQGESVAGLRESYPRLTDEMIRLA